MKLRIFTFITMILVATVAFNSCKKEITTDPQGLPLLTQEGKNTFGFLLNGKVWTPNGDDGTPDLSLYYELTYSRGTFNLSAHRNISSSNGQRQSIIIYGDSIQTAQKITLPSPGKIGFDFWDEGGNCTYSSNEFTTTLVGGFFDIKKLDRNSRIFSGEFELKFRKDGCPDVEITQGRFDMKF